MKSTKKLSFAKPAQKKKGKKSNSKIASELLILPARFSLLDPIMPARDDDDDSSNDESERRLTTRGRASAESYHQSPMLRRAVEEAVQLNSIKQQPKHHSPPKQPRPVARQKSAQGIIGTLIFALSACSFLPYDASIHTRVLSSQPPAPAAFAPKASSRLPPKPRTRST